MKFIAVVALLLFSAPVIAAEATYSPEQISSCRKILADVRLIMDRVETVRGGIPYNFYVSPDWWAGKNVWEKKSLITAISTCKHVIHGERVVHILDSMTGRELGRTGIGGPVIK